MHGRIDILYNNASTPRFGAIDELAIEDWKFVMDNTLNVVFYACKAAWPELKRHGAGGAVRCGDLGDRVGEHG